MVDFDQANAMLLEAISQKLVDNQLTSEEAGKLLNTIARFEERTRELPSKPQTK
jgi:hypothetical protein